MVESDLMENQEMPCDNKDGTLQNQDLLQFLSDADFPQIGKRPSTWQDCVKALKDEMTNHVVIRAMATIFSLNINVIDWNGVSSLLSFITYFVLFLKSRTR